MPEIFVVFLAGVVTTLALGYLLSFVQRRWEKR